MASNEQHKREELTPAFWQLQTSGLSWGMKPYVVDYWKLAAIMPRRRPLPRGNCGVCHQEVVLISCQRHLLPVLCTPLLAFPSSIRLHADWLGCKYTCTLMSNYRTMNANMYRWQRIESLKYTCRRSVERRDHRANAEFCAWPCGPKVLIERWIVWNA